MKLRKLGGGARPVQSAVGGSQQQQQQQQPKPSDNRESKDVSYRKRMLAKATSILRAFECPHSPICVFLREGRLELCPFSHGHVDDPELKPLPNYVCVPFLLNVCIKPYLPEAVLADRPLCLECRNAQNGQCEFGLHVRPAQLARFEEYEANLMRIEAFRSLYPDDQYMCIVCHENIRLERRAPEMQEFCILGGCHHVHCAQCMRFDRLLRARCGVRCPGADKALFVHFRATIADDEEKRSLFRDVPSLELAQRYSHRSIAEAMQPISEIERIYEEHQLGEVPRDPRDFRRSMVANLDNEPLRLLMHARINSRPRFDWSDLLRHFDDGGSSWRLHNDDVYNLPLSYTIHTEGPTPLSLLP